VKKLNINWSMIFMMVIAVTLVGFGLAAVFDANILGEAAGNYLTQHRLFGFALVLVGLVAGTYSVMSRDGLMRKHFSQR